MSVDLRKFGEDVAAYHEVLGRIRERARITEIFRLAASQGVGNIGTLLAINLVNSEPIPNLPAPLLPEERK